LAQKVKIYLKPESKNKSKKTYICRVYTLRTEGLQPGTERKACKKVFLCRYTRYIVYEEEW